MVVVEKKNGIIRLRGRNKGEWMLVPFWPCTGNTVRKLARPGLSKDWVEEVAAFAESEDVLS